jgi:hypothetical protein
MNEGETPVPAHDPAPRKSDRKALFVAIAMVLGLVVLVALNMK